MVLDHPSHQDDGNQQAHTDEDRRNSRTDVRDSRPLLTYPRAVKRVAQDHEPQDTAEQDEAPVAEAAD